METEKLTYEYYRHHLEEFNKYKYKDMVPFECCECGKRYEKNKRVCRNYLAREHIKQNFCSSSCHSKARDVSVTKPCPNCSNPVTRNISVITKSLKNGGTDNLFCDHSCAAKYNNTHKTKGNRCSKLEVYILEELKKHFPSLKIMDCDKTAINSELDLYFPELKFAVELNGIFHYEPIYGEDKLERIKLNDKNKMIKCYEAGIELMVLDVSKIKRFTEQNSQEPLKIIKEQIEKIIGRKE